MFFLGIRKPLNMVEKWKLCIEVSCYPNPGKAVITYVLSNIATSKFVQRKMNISGRTTNNEAYYIGLIEGLETTMEYGSNRIVVFTNFELVCSQMNGVYQVKKERLKELHGITNNIVSQFQFFSIRHCTNVNKMSYDLLRGAMQIQDSSIKDELIDELELYRAMAMQDPPLKDELVLRCSSSKIQDSSLKGELVL